MNDHFQIKIPWKGWNVIRLLGAGSFGKVYEIERDVFGTVEKAAMKVISVPESKERLDDLYSSGLDSESVSQWCSRRIDEIIREYTVMLRLRGISNIVDCFDIDVMPHENDPGSDIFIRMELLTSLNKLLGMIQKDEHLRTDEERKTLQKLRPEHLEFGEDDVIRLGKDIARALEICEKNNIVHRDIKPENILLNDNGDYKLGDFGTARRMDHTTAATFAGTERYMAPEVIKGGKTGKDVDTYALGLVMYRLLNRGRFPFFPLTGIPTAEEVENAQRRRLAGEPFDPPVDGSPELKALVMKACAYDRKDRFASASEMMEKIKKVEELAAERSVRAKDDIPAPVYNEKDKSDDAWEDEEDNTLSSDPLALDRKPVIPVGQSLEPDDEQTVSDSWSDADVTMSADAENLEPEHIQDKQTTSEQNPILKGKEFNVVKYLLLVGTLIIISVISIYVIVGNSNTYSWNGVSFSLPSNWTEADKNYYSDDSKIKTLRRWVPESSVKSHVPEMYLDVRRLDTQTYMRYKNEGFDGLVKYYKNKYYCENPNYYSDYSSIEVLGKGVVEIDGTECYSFRYDTTESKEYSELNFRHDVLWIPIKDGHSVVQVEFVNDLDKNKNDNASEDEIGEKIIKSVRIDKD